MTINTGLAVDDYIASGDEALRSGDAAAAITYYTMAINTSGGTDQDQYRAYSNRSMAHLQANNAHSALEDANSSLRLNSESPEAYIRRGAALQSLKLYEDSITTYKQGLNMCPEDEEIKKALNLVEERVKSQTKELEEWENIETSLPQLPQEVNTVADTVVNTEEEAITATADVIAPFAECEPLPDEVEEKAIEKAPEEPRPAPPAENPGLWKLTGRKIRQYKVGATVLDGIRDGLDAVEKQVKGKPEEAKN